MAFSISANAESTIVTLESKDLFDSLGYTRGEVVHLKAGDFGEGGGGNRPIKSIKENGTCEDEVAFYYPYEYRIETSALTPFSLSKIPLHAIKVFNISLKNGVKKITFQEIYSLDLEFEGKVDFNELTLEKMFSFVTVDAEDFSFEDIHSIELRAIIEP